MSWLIAFANLFVITSVLFLTSCDPKEPEITFCQLNPQEFSSYCIDSKTGKEYERPLSNLRGWISTSPEDFGEIKKYYKEIKDELEACRKQ